MAKTQSLILSILLLSGAFLSTVLAQMKGLHGDFTGHRSGLHAGNQFRTTFYNDGWFGAMHSPPDVPGEWPINSGHLYLIAGVPFVGSEVIDAENSVKHIVSDVTSLNFGNAAGDRGPNGEWWTFLPLPGFANPADNRIAMSKWPEAWPPYWPDKMNDVIAPGWPGAWNGYFGKNIFNADEESYFVSDDYHNREFNFYPDTTDLSRRGLGMRMYVRGFQWSNALVEDALFILYDIENIGTYEHDKMIFAFDIGNNMGESWNMRGEGGDDMGAFNLQEDVAYLYDYNNVGVADWGPEPVGYFGGAFLESPGNPFDGIDNDGDGRNGSGKFITEALFAPKTLAVGQEIIIINYSTFARTKKLMPEDTVRIHYQDLTFKFWPGKILTEIPFNLVDDNLNGIIDENNGVSFGEGSTQTTTYLYTGHNTKICYIDYFTGAGLDNPLIDERRDDRIDNDGDWDPAFDDTGADGVPYTNDPGERDGIPTSGEPHFDKTDIDETDMIGLTSFTLYTWESMANYDDEKVWQNTRPGYFDDLMENDNIELLYGSGYFPMKPGQIERFSMGLVCGVDLNDFMINKYWVAKAYNENYNFTKAPNIPTVTAIPGDNQVTLVWDDFAEKSIDPITGQDFEGYRIYRSTDPGWNDLTPITDGRGHLIYREPLAQFDLKNDLKGYAAVPVKGVHFWLGEDTGIQHSFVDTTALNGYTYYYAVTAYDRGDAVNSIPPTECTKFISISSSGAIDKGSNVIVVRPAAPVAGFLPARFDSAKILSSVATTTDGRVGYQILFPEAVKDATYEITFMDTTIGANKFRATQYFRLTNVTTGEVVIPQDTAFHDGEEPPISDGFRLTFQGNPALLELDRANSNWSRAHIAPYDVLPYSYANQAVELMSADFEIIFGDVGLDTSTAFYRGTREIPAAPVNFSIFNTTLQEKIRFAFRERDFRPGEQGKFTTRTDRTLSDEIILLNADHTPGWLITFSFAEGDTLQPGPGDRLVLKFNKPFLRHDVFRFTTHAALVDENLAHDQLTRIRVVPNPYIVANSWEPANPYANGRGPRELHFTHLPQKCTIRIFNLRGQLVATLEHDSEMWNGAAIWNMQTKDHLDIAYGVYIYHVDAKEIGTWISKFAVIK